MRKKLATIIVLSLSLATFFCGCDEKKEVTITEDSEASIVTSNEEKSETTAGTPEAEKTEYDRFKDALAGWSGIDLPADDGTITMTELWIEDGSDGGEGWAEGEGVIGAHFTASADYFEEARVTITSTLGEPVQEESGMFVVWSCQSSEVEGTVNELIMDQAEAGEIGFKYHKNMPTE